MPQTTTEHETRERIDLPGYSRELLEIAKRKCQEAGVKWEEGCLACSPMYGNPEKLVTSSGYEFQPCPEGIAVRAFGTNPEYINGGGEYGIEWVIVGDGQEVLCRHYRERIDKKHNTTVTESVPTGNLAAFLDIKEDIEKPEVRFIQLRLKREKYQPLRV